MDTFSSSYNAFLHYAKTLISKLTSLTLNEYDLVNEAYLVCVEKNISDYNGILGIIKGIYLNEFQKNQSVTKICLSGSTYYKVLGDCQCKQCKNVKPFSEFRIRTTYSTGYKYQMKICKQCESDNEAARRSKNLLLYKERNKKYRENSIDVRLKKSRKNNQKHCKKLTDTYIKSLFVKQGIPQGNITDEMIAKRKSKIRKLRAKKMIKIRSL